MVIVENAVDRFIENLKDEDEFVYKAKESYGYFGTGVRTAEAYRLRMDWELDYNEPVEPITAMSNLLKEDLTELIKNGDKDSDDPLLRVGDGVIKRGVSPTLVDIIYAHLRKSDKPKKESTEYTIHFVLAVRWN